MKSLCLFVTRNPIELWQPQDKEAMPIPFGRRYHLNGLELWSAYFGQKPTLHSAHSPANHTI